MIVQPQEIEKQSFRIIREELDHPVDPVCEPLVVRVIHTTADFEYAKILCFQYDAVPAGIMALRRGCRIYADTAMICAGVSKPLLKQLSCEIYSRVGDSDVATAAQERGVTRSIVGMESALADPETRVFVIGNAPTALMTLIDAVKEQRAAPALVIGVPVGFVGASESKEALMHLPVPSIVTHSRKGGSTVAAALLNALLKLAVVDSEER